MAHRRRRGVACHQRKIREQAMRDDPRPVMTSLDGCTVEYIPEAEARTIIVRYEWLGTVGVPSICTGLRDPQGELIGVALFGHPGSPEAGNLCGPDVPTLCLMRGACVHWAHPHAASFLVSRAVKLSGAEVVYAYADPEAGEIGTIYQACNWLYLGQGVGRGRNSGTARYEQVRDPSGAVYAARALRHRGLTIREAKAMGWTPIKTVPKHKYCTLVGDKRRRRQVHALLRFPALPYPKR
jgi:hypothetical protein